jgi:VanZ family protein
MNIAGFLSLWAPVIVWAGLIYFLSSIPHLNSGLGTWDTILRKGAHIFEYTVLTALLLRAFKRTGRGWPWRRAWITAAVLAVAYAGSDEFHQAFVPGRGPSLRDVLVDGVGVAIAIGFFKRMKLYE